MNKSSITAVVLGMLCLSSCYSRSELESKKRKSNLNTTHKVINTRFNGINIDTTVTETVITIDQADDELGLAYGTMRQFNNSEVVEVFVAAPYSTIIYYPEDKKHRVNIKLLLLALNKPNTLANVHKKSVSLANYN